MIIQYWEPMIIQCGEPMINQYWERMIIQHWETMISTKGSPEFICSAFDGQFWRYIKGPPPKARRASKHISEN